MSLEFEPVGDRKVADIRGTLALDRATGALRRLDFTFVNIARDIQREGAGGRVNFRPLPSGGWIIDRWALRFPMLERVFTQQSERGHDIRFGNRGQESKYELYAMQEAGGEVTEVSLGDTVVWQLERPQLTGVVRDTRGAPIPGATVAIPTLGRRAVTDGSGRFAMRAVRRGRRTIARDGERRDGQARRRGDDARACRRAHRAARSSGAPIRHIALARYAAVGSADGPTVCTPHAGQ